MTEHGSEDLWAQITALPRPSRAVPFPRNWPEGLPEGHAGHGKAGEPVDTVHIVVLTHAEQMAAMATAEDVAKKACKEAPKRGEDNLGYENLYGNASTVEILFRACKRADLKTPYFLGTKAVHANLTLDELGVLMSQYLITQEQLGPLTSRMSAGEVDAWLSRLEKAGADASPLAFLSSGARNELLMHLASRVLSSKTATSSPGSQPDDTTSEPNPTSNEEETIA